MSISFNDLHLPETYEHESNLNTLKAWYKEHISQDIDYEGSEQEQYALYYTGAAHYLDNFLAHRPSNSGENASFFGNQSTIHYAAQQGYDRYISAQPVIAESIINEGDAYKMTPLHKAAIQGHEFTVRALLSKGASVHLANAQDQLAIHAALFVPMLHDVQLVQRKERIFFSLLPLTPESLTMQDKDGNTLLHLLTTQSFDNLIAQLIQNHSELAFIKNHASLYPIHTAILNSQAKAVDLLLSINGVAELGDTQKCLALHYAARYGTAAMVRSCCDAAADSNSRDALGRTPLLWAASAGNNEVFNALIKNGADTSLVDYNGSSILHFAVKEQNESIVHWIVDNLGDSLLNQVDNEHQSPLFYAQRNQNRAIEELLISKGAHDSSKLKY